jgi:NitT/TauT family transport system substrate-binding protein
MVMKPKLLLTAGCLYVLAAALFVAGDSTQARAQASAGPVRKVRIAIPSISASHMPVYMAKELGYYSDEGLDTEIILMRGGLSIQAVVAGSVDYTGTPGATVAAAVQGVKLVVLMGYSNKPLYDLIVNPEVSSYAELKGKRFGIGSLIGFSYEIPRVMLSRNGLDLKKDVTTILIGPTADRMTALRANAIQATILEPPFNFMVLNEGFRKLGYSGDYYQNLQGALTTSQLKIKTEPEEVRRFVKATARGFLAYREQRKLALPIMRRYLKLDLRFSGQVYDYNRASLTPDGTISEELMRGIIETQRQASKTSRAIDPDEIFNFSFVREAMKQLTRR